MIKLNRKTIADEAVELLSQTRPDLVGGAGPQGRTRVNEAIRGILPFVTDALDNDAYFLLKDYLAWLKVFLTSHDAPPAYLGACLECLATVLPPHLPDADRARVRAMLHQARTDVEQLPGNDNVSLIGPAAGLALSAIWLGGFPAALGVLAGAVALHLSAGAQATVAVGLALLLRIRRVTGTDDSDAVSGLKG